MKFILSLVLAAVLAPTMTMAAFVMEVSSSSSPADACKEEDDMVLQALREALISNIEESKHRHLEEDPCDMRPVSIHCKDVWTWLDHCSPGRCPEDLGWFCFWNCRHGLPGTCWYVLPYRYVIHLTTTIQNAFSLSFSSI